MPQGVRQAIAANSGGEQEMISPLAREIVFQTHGKSSALGGGYPKDSNVLRIATETYRSPPSGRSKGEIVR